MSNYKEGGYDRKYIIQKSSGKPIDPKAEYFVLRLDKDPHALKALSEYIDSVQLDNPRLAYDLIVLLSKMHKIQDKKALENTDG